MATIGPVLKQWVRRQHGNWRRRLCAALCTAFSVLIAILWLLYTWWRLRGGTTNDALVTPQLQVWQEYVAEARAEYSGASSCTLRKQPTLFLFDDTNVTVVWESTACPGWAGLHHELQWTRLAGSHPRRGASLRSARAQLRGGRTGRVWHRVPANSVQLTPHAVAYRAVLGARVRARAGTVNLVGNAGILSVAGFAGTADGHNVDDVDDDDDDDISMPASRSLAPAHAASSSIAFRVVAYRQRQGRGRGRGRGQGQGRGQGRAHGAELLAPTFDSDAAYASHTFHSADALPPVAKVKVKAIRVAAPLSLPFSVPAPRRGRQGGLVRDKHGPVLARFAVLGDSQSGAVVFRRLLRRAAAWRQPRVSLLVHLGDMVQSANIFREWHAYWFGPLSDSGLAQRVPTLYARGNHDGEGAAATAYGAQPQKWFAATVRGVRWIVLDSNDKTGGGTSSMIGPQLQWLENELQSVHARTALLRVVIVHIPPFLEFWEPGAWRRGESEWGRFVRDSCVPLFERFGVDVVISGHSHIYQRGTRNGVTYVITGGAGGELEDEVGGRVQDFAFYNVTRAAHHYGLLELGRCKARWRAFGLWGGDERAMDEVEVQLGSLEPLRSPPGCK